MLKNYQRTKGNVYEYIVGVYSSLERVKKAMGIAISNDEIFNLKKIPEFEAGRKNLVLLGDKARDCFAFSNNSLDRNGDISKYEILCFELNGE